MSTLSARNLTQALSQAKNVGLVEEPFVVAGVAVVVRNLRPDEYDAIYKECQGLQDVEYMNTWQLGHVGRAIVELNGVNLRDVQFVEDEEPNPKQPGKTIMVKLELYGWLLKNVVGTWGREAIFIAYRKVADAIEAAEKQSQAGITFRVADESSEEKFRRLIAEAKEIEGDVPERLRDSILADNGFMTRTTAEELQKADEKLAAVVQEPSPAPAPVQQAPQEAPEAPVEAPEAGPPTPARMAEILRQRVPMNQQPGVSAPMPTTQATREAPQVNIRPNQPPIPTNATPQGKLSGRAAETAALEADADMIGALEGSSQLPKPTTAIPEIRLGSQPKIDPKGAIGIMETPPAGGINPRFRPPQRA